MRTIRYYTAWLIVIIMVAVATIALTLITFETKVSYGFYRLKPKFRPKGKHRRPKTT